MRATCEILEKEKLSSIISADIIDVTQIPEIEEPARTRAEQIISGVGSLALNGAAIERPDNTDNITSLQDALMKAKSGDARARSMVEINVKTDALERTMKAGFIMDVTIEADEQDNLHQFGQPLEHINANALRWASGNDTMFGRSSAETRNTQRLMRCRELGLLEDNIFVVMSRTDDRMSVDELRAASFFPDTMSISLQGTTEDSQGTLNLESAFVAGADSAYAERFDATMLADALYMLSGGEIDVYGLNATQLLDHAWLIPKTLLPHGMIDLVQTCDNVASRGHERFFGQQKSRQDYLEYRKWCKDFSSNLTSIVALITDELIAGARPDDTPQKAAQRLDKICARYMVTESIHNEKIDPYVFGGVSATYIYEARHQLELGNYDKANRAAGQAQKHQASGSCAKALQDNGLAQGDSGDEDEKLLNNSGSKEEDYKFDQLMYCKVCQAPPEKGATKKHCGPCGICRDCDNNIRKKNNQSRKW